MKEQKIFKGCPPKAELVVDQGSGVAPHSTAIPSTNTTNTPSTVQDTKNYIVVCDNKLEYNSICETMKNQQCHTRYSTINKTIQHRHYRKVDTQL